MLFGSNFEFDPRKFTYEFTRFRRVAGTFRPVCTRQTLIWHPCIDFLLATRAGNLVHVRVESGRDCAGENTRGLADHFQLFLNGHGRKRVKTLIYYVPSLDRIRHSSISNLHIPEHCPLRLHPKQFHVIFHSFSSSLPVPAPTSHSCHNHISTGRQPDTQSSLSLLYQCSNHRAICHASIHQPTLWMDT